MSHYNAGGRGPLADPWAEVWISWGSVSEADHRAMTVPEEGHSWPGAVDDKQAERAAWGPSSLSLGLCFISSKMGMMLLASRKGLDTQGLHPGECPDYVGKPWLIIGFVSVSQTLRPDLRLTACRSFDTGRPLPGD